MPILFVSVGALCFLLGIVAVQQWASLPSVIDYAAMTLVSVFLWRLRYRPLFWVVIGLLWGSLYGHWRLSHALPEPLNGSDVELEGYIASLPQRQDNRVSFDFVVTQSPLPISGKVRLSWYYPDQTIAAGQRWQLTAKLKQPHARLNPGNFDYQAWLFANHIVATGYVRNKPIPYLKTEGETNIGVWFAQWRQRIADRLQAALPDSSQLGVIKALTIGSQDGISQTQWQLFRQTGVIHLIVISGSHISLVAGLIYALLRKLWIRSGVLRISPQTVAAWGAWLGAVFYSGLAGFSIPTLRALIMLSVVLLALIRQRHLSHWHVLIVALLAVLLFDPLAVLSVGFWLSFVAVGLLLYLSAGRLGSSNAWQGAVMMHIAMAIGLSPLLLLFFQQISLVSPLANLLAAPFVGLFAVPLALLAVLLSFVSNAAAHTLLLPVEFGLQALQTALEYMAHWPLATFSNPQPPLYTLFFAGLGVLLLLAPRGFPARHLSLPLFLPLFFVETPKPQSGDAWLTLLDVGQGLATVVQTAEHTLVFDTGAKYAEQSDMGEVVVLPFLQHQGVGRIDTLVISHADNDHSGGAASIIATLSVGSVLSSVPESITGSMPCRAGQQWQWDGVLIKMLSPDNSPFESENDNSCVLKVESARHSFLLTGDIERDAERYLVDKYGDALKSQVLIAPHHGSKTSSTDPFLTSVAADWVLIPAGYMNRFRFPHPSVLQRYRKYGITWLSIADQGAIFAKSDAEGLHVDTARHQYRKYWLPSNDPLVEDQ